MKIAILGAGAIGSLVAGKLAKLGVDVTLLGRKDQVEAVRSRGLTIVSSEGTETVKVRVAEKLDGEYDLVIFTVKTQDLEMAYQDNHEFLENARIMTSQNGVQADNILCTHFDRDKMVSSIVMFGATYVRPGEVTFNFPGKWIIGKPYDTNDQDTHDLAQFLGKAFPVEVTQDIMGMKWTKLFVNFNNCIPAIIGASMQETYADMDFCRLSILLLKEGVDMIQKATIDLISLPDFPADRIYGLASMETEQGAGIINQTLTKLSKEPLYGSILQSIKRGKPSEIDFINGEVVQVAKSMRQRAPLNEKIVDMVHQVEMSGQFLKPEDVKKAFSLN